MLEMAPSISEHDAEAYSGMFQAEAEQSSFKTELDLEQNVLDRNLLELPEQSSSSEVSPSCESVSEPVLTGKQSMPDTDMRTLQDGPPTWESYAERPMEPSVSSAAELLDFGMPDAMELHHGPSESPHSQLILPAMGDLELPAQLPPSCDLGLHHDLEAQPAAPTVDTVEQL